MRSLGLTKLLMGSSLAWCPPAASQWAVGAEVGADRFWGGSAETTPEGRSFRPYRPTTFGVGVVRRSGTWGVGLHIRYASAALALEGHDALVIAAVGAGNQLLLHGGPLFEIWSVTDEGSRSRVGVQAAVSLLMPLGGRLAGTLSTGAALTPSPFTSDQLDTGFERRALWRRRVAGGLEYRL
jgi:hypothetical protein